MSIAWKKKKMYTWAYPLYISFIIVCLLLEQRDHILYISYIIYNRMFLYCLEKKKGVGGGERMYTWVYDTYLIYHLSSFVCTLLENVYMSTYFIYHNSMIHRRLSVYCLEREKSVYMSISLILYIIYHCLSVARKKGYMGHSENWTKEGAFSRWNKNLTKTWNFLNYRHISDVMCFGEIRGMPQ